MTIPEDAVEKARKIAAEIEEEINRASCVAAGPGERDRTGDGKNERQSV